MIERLITPHILEDLKPPFKYVITLAGEAWTRSDGVRICSLPEFLENDLVEMCK